MRREYEMTQVQLDAIMDACKPVPYIVIGGHAPRSPQENANDAWERLGEELGFRHMTVQPLGVNPRRFTAEPKE
jgi:predicted TIM-barrel fold metal-dependent hydrolase